VWLGVSAEDQRRADERIPLLLRTPAAVRFVSAEPLLGPLDLSNWLRYAGCANGGRRCELTGGPACRDGCFPLDWLIVGGESGPGARPCDLRWIRSLAEQCRAGGVACFVKQLGARPVGMAWKIRDRKGGDWDEWTDDLRVRDFPEPCHAA
jgi:protein gp37